MRLFKKKIEHTKKKWFLAPVGARSERLMSESLNCSFKRFVQTADSSDVYAWANETLTQPILQNTESFSNESNGCCEMRCGYAKNVSDLILLYLIIELFIELLKSCNVKSLSGVA